MTKSLPKLLQDAAIKLVSYRAIGIDK